MPKEGVPEKRIFPSQEDKTVTSRKYDMMLSLLKGELEDVDSQLRPTALDFQGLNPELSEDQILQWIEKEIGIPAQLINEDGVTPESKKKYFLINHAFQQAKDFLRYTMKYGDKDLKLEPDAIESKQDLFDLLNKTKLVGGTRGLLKTMLYCRLVKVTLATFETLKHDALLLEELTEEFEGALVSSVRDGEKSKTPLVLLSSGNDKKRFYAEEDASIQGKIETRGKKIRSAILRFINRAEANASAALKDGIASRITITEEQAVDLLPILYKWLVEEMGVDFVQIRDESFFVESNKKVVVEKLEKTLQKKHFSFSDYKSNPTSMGDFQALKITGLVENLGKKNGDANQPSAHARQFEIQFVFPDTKNEEGKMHHSIYNVMKLVSARTRLDGGCPEDIFEQFVQDAHKESQISIQDIKRYLLEEKNAPIVIKKQKNGKNVYVAYSVYSRWDGFGWVDEKLMEEIRDAKIS